MMDAKKIVLEYVCPSFGLIAANQMFIAPYRDVQNAIRRGSLGDLNPLPWAVMLGNCCGWILYGILTHNYFIFFANTQGFLLAAWFNLAASKLLFQEQVVMMATTAKGTPTEAAPTDAMTTSTARESPPPMVVEDQIHSLPSDSTKDKLMAAPGSIISALDDVPPTVATATISTTTTNLTNTIHYYHAPRHDFWVVAMMTFWLIIISILGFGRDVLSSDTQQFIVGIVVNLNLVFFYGAPLSTIVRVMRERNAATIHVWTMITNTANGVFWMAYGLAVLDWFVAVPNGLGAILGAIQMVLCVIFPRIESTHNNTTSAMATTNSIGIMDPAGMTSPLVNKTNIKEDQEVGLGMSDFASGETALTSLDQSGSILAMPLTASAHLAVDHNV